MSQSPTSRGSIECRHHAGSAIVSIQTREVELSADEGVGVVAAVGGNANPPQIIIHEFLKESDTQEHHHHHHHHHVPHPVGGAITIVTPPRPTSASSAVSRINICINNHYQMPRIEAKPGLRRHHEQFGLADDVLVHDARDDRYYLGTIIAIGECKCLVRFDDNTERWAAFGELTKMVANEGNGESATRNATDYGAKCVVCKEQKPQQQVEVCDRCQRGYHRQCQLGSDTNGDGMDSVIIDGTWLCRRCISPEVCLTAVLPSGLAEELEPLTDKNQLSYDLDALEWDALHQVNTASCYCYCGEDGDWAKEMIQCCWCQQWFHGRCIRSLQYPIFLGDQYYLFLCSICNHGHEFVRRLEVSCADLAHLALYNLIMRNGPRFYDFGRAIMPYIEDNLRTLQVPVQFANIPAAAREEMIRLALRGHKERFINGVELHKPSTLWTLRESTVPPKMVIDIPRGQTVTENLLRKLTASSDRFHFIQRLYLERNFLTDAVSRERMTGVKYCQPPYSEEDPRADPLFIESLHAMSYETQNGNNGSWVGVEGGPSVVKHRGRPPRASSWVGAVWPTASIEDANGASTSTVVSLPAQASGNRRKYRAGNSQARRLELELALADTCDSSDSTSTRTRSTLDAIIPPPKDFRGKNNPFYNEVSRPRQARMVKRRLSAKDIQSRGRGKKRKMNNGRSMVVRAPPPALFAVLPQNGALRKSAVAVPTRLHVVNLQERYLQQQVEQGRTVEAGPSNRLPYPSVPLVAGSAHIAPPYTHAHQSRRLRPRNDTNYSDSRRYRKRVRRSTDGDEWDAVGLNHHTGCNGEASRPQSSLSSSDTVESSLSTIGGDVVPLDQEQRQPEPEQQQQQQEPQQQQQQQVLPGPIEPAPPLPYAPRRVRSGGIVRGIRTLPDGHQEYLIEN